MGEKLNRKPGPEARQRSDSWQPLIAVGPPPFGPPEGKLIRVAKDRWAWSMSPGAEDVYKERKEEEPVNEEGA